MLGAGGVYGLAHLGVLRVLEAEGIVPDFVVGSSIGAVVGALYGSGIRGDDLVRLATALRRSHWLDLRPTRMGLVAGEKLFALLRLLTRDQDLEALDPPLAVVATDVERGERVVFEQGRAAERVRASASIPGIFPPVVIDGRTLVDGAILERVPVRTARELGAERVLAVSLGGIPRGGSIAVHNLFDVVMQSFDIMEREIYELTPHTADLTLEPEVLSAPRAIRQWAAAFVEAGEAAAVAALPAIRALFQEVGS